MDLYLAGSGKAHESDGKLQLEGSLLFNVRNVLEDAEYSETNYATTSRNFATRT
jgi:hypothetical protein